MSLAQVERLSLSETVWADSSTQKIEVTFGLSLDGAAPVGTWLNLPLKGSAVQVVGAL